MRELTTTEYAVLGMLASGPRSGYDIQRSAEWSVGAMWAPSKSQIYKVLPRLVDAGCARTRSVAQAARPDKSIFSITPHGRAALRAWVDAVDADPAGGGPVFLMKIFFGWAGSPGAAEAQLDAYESWLRPRRERYRAMEERLSDDEPIHSRIALRHALKRLDATLSWVQDARALLAGVTAVLVLAGLAAPQAGHAVDGCTPTRGDVAFRAADGVRLAGHVFGRGDVAVVLAHQSNGSVCQWQRYGPRLARLGYRALAFDFRNYGASQRASVAASARFGGDVAAAVRYLRGQGARKVFLLGASMGGSAVIQAGANVTPPVDGVISVSPSESFADAPAAAARLEAPALFVAASRDPGAPEQARALYRRATGPKDILVVDDWRHGYALLDDNATVRARVERFLYSKRSP